MRQVPGDPEVNDAVAIQLRQIVDRYGLEVCEDPRRVEALLRDLSGEHRREIAVLVGAAREGLPSELLASRNSVLPAVLGERLARKLQDNLGLGDEAGRWAVSAWALALGVSGFAPPAPASGKQQGTRQTVHPPPEDVQIRITRLLSEAIDAAQLTWDAPRQCEKPWLLADIAGMLAATDPERAARLRDDAERVARSVTGEIDKGSAILGLAVRLAGTDPDRALRLARSIDRVGFRVQALAEIAGALAATDPERAARLREYAERLVRSVTDEELPNLPSIVESLAGTDPDRAAPRLVDHGRIPEGAGAVGHRERAGRHGPGPRAAPRPVDHGRAREGEGPELRCEGAGRHGPGARRPALRRRGTPCPVDHGYRNADISRERGDRHRTGPRAAPRPVDRLPGV